MKRSKFIALTIVLCWAALAFPVQSSYDTGTRVVHFADVNINSAGDNSVIAAVAGKRIVVRKLWLVSEGGVAVKFKHGASEFNARALPLTANGSSGFWQNDGMPHWVTAQNEAFIINLSGAVAVTGRIGYTLE